MVDLKEKRTILCVIGIIFICFFIIFFSIDLGEKEVKYETKIKTSVVTENEVAENGTKKGV